MTATMTTASDLRSAEQRLAAGLDLAANAASAIGTDALAALERLKAATGNAASLLARVASEAAGLLAGLLGETLNLAGQFEAAFPAAPPAPAAPAQRELRDDSSLNSAPALPAPKDETKAVEKDEKPVAGDMAAAPARVEAWKANDEQWKKALASGLVGDPVPADEAIDLGIGKLSIPATDSQPQPAGKPAKRGKKNKLAG